MRNEKYQRKKRKSKAHEGLASSILGGDDLALSKAITLVESKKEVDNSMADEILNSCLSATGQSLRIGITGVPGVGKSTFIEQFGLYLIKEHQKKVAVLAIDPSSKRSKGSILGDKTRMEALSKHPKAFIRPSPSSGTLGGVASATRESMLLCEAAGYEVILVETVGVGQSETEVKEMTDFFLLLMLAGAGDELQGIKRGIMEMADGIMINKAEGNKLPLAKKAKRAYQNALHLFPPNENAWTTQVELCSALKGENLDLVWKMMHHYVQLTKENGFFEKQRKSQLLSWFEQDLTKKMNQKLYQNKTAKEKIIAIKEQISRQSLSPKEGAKMVFDVFLKNN